MHTLGPYGSPKAGRTKTRLLTRAAMLALTKNIASCGKGDGPIDKVWVFELIDTARAILRAVEEG